MFRYLSDVLTAHHGYDETEFWTQVRDAITAYQAEFPELSDRFETFDLLQPTFTKLCLNRNRLTEEGYSDTASRPRRRTRDGHERPA